MKSFSKYFEMEETLKGYYKRLNNAEYNIERLRRVCAVASEQYKKETGRDATMDLENMINTANGLNILILQMRREMRSFRKSCGIKGGK